MKPPLHKTGGRARPSQVRRTFTSRGDAVDTFSRGGITYQLQRVRCGNKRCQRCRSGPAHGPYWYAYFWSKGATRSKYVGKSLPASVLTGVDQADGQQQPANKS